MSDRQVDAATMRQVARTRLGWLACEYADREAYEHDHTLCVRDDSSYAADVMWSLLEATAEGDEGVALDRLQDLMAAVKHPE